MKNKSLVKALSLAAGILFTSSAWSEEFSVPVSRAFYDEEILTLSVGDKINWEPGSSATIQLMYSPKGVVAWRKDATDEGNSYTFGKEGIYVYGPLSWHFGNPIPVLVGDVSQKDLEKALDEVKEKGGKSELKSALRRAISAHPDPELHEVKKTGISTKSYSHFKAQEGDSAQWTFKGGDTIEFVSAPAGIDLQALTAEAMSGTPVILTTKGFYLYSVNGEKVYASMDVGDIKFSDVGRANGMANPNKIAMEYIMRRMRPLLR